MKQISDKMIVQKQGERELSQKLLERCRGFCEDCGQWPDWRGLSKHEIKFRSRGGDPLDESNCLMLCGRCHSQRHGIRELSDHIAKISN